MRKQFVKTLRNLLHTDDRTVLFLGDISVFGFKDEIKTLPLRAYNIGILEQSTISLAAGIAKCGLIPFVHTIAPFIVERGFEQLKVDFGYQELNGNFISVGGSYDYSSLGCTHHCPADVGLLSNIPGMEILIPGTSSEVDTLIIQSYNNSKPTYTRLSEYENKINFDTKHGKGVLVKEGSKATIICYGPMLQSVIDAAADLDVTLLYYTSIMPFDYDLLRENFNENIIICEPFYEGSTNHLIHACLVDKKYRVTNIGIPRKFLFKYGSKEQHDNSLKLDTSNIRDRLKQCIK